MHARNWNFAAMSGLDAELRGGQSVAGQEDEARASFDEEQDDRRAYVTEIRDEWARTAQKLAKAAKKNALDEGQFAVFLTHHFIKAVQDGAKRGRDHKFAIDWILEMLP